MMSDGPKETSHYLSLTESKLELEVFYVFLCQQNYNEKCKANNKS